jgi:hypothetical protein
MLERLIHNLESKRGPKIDEIWAFDAVNHGGSAEMNASDLGDVCK